MEVDYDEAVTRLKENLDKAKNLHIRAEARLEQLNRQKKELLKEIEEIGVRPEELDSEIERLKNEIDELIREANEMLPDDETGNI